MLAAMRSGRSFSAKSLLQSKALLKNSRACIPIRPFSKWIDNDVYIEDFSQFVKRNMILFKSKMISRKWMVIQNPFANPGTVERWTIPLSVSDLAGHGSFLFLALSYLESDFLNLRVYAMSGLFLSIFFQYYRENPLWIPIRWNSLFLLINAVMIALLLKAEQDAHNIPEEQKELYHQVFEHKGMKSVDYLKLISCATKMEVKKGEKLVDETKKNTRVYLVKKGHLSVYRKDQKVGVINENQFVGAMSFLSWQDPSQSDESQAQEGASKSITTTNEAEVSPKSEKADDHGAAHHHWPFFFHHNSSSSSSDTPNPLSNSTTTTTTGASTTSSPHSTHNQEPVDLNGLAIISQATHTHPSPDHPHSHSHSHSHPVEGTGSTWLGNTLYWYETTYMYLFGGNNHSDTTAATAASPVSDSSSSSSSSTASNSETPSVTDPSPPPSPLEEMLQSSILLSALLTEDVHPAAISSDENVLSPADHDHHSSDDPNAIPAEEEGLTGRANVICEEDCEVYSWSFTDLQSLIHQSPMLGLVFERCLSDDLNKKMTSTWDEELRHRYKQLLYGVVMDGEVKEDEKVILEKFREIYHISSSDHEAILAELDWKTEEFVAGYKGAPNKDIIEEYMLLLQVALFPSLTHPSADDSPNNTNTLTVSSEAKQSLRQFRQAHNIKAELHLTLLKKLGWSYDEFEDGCKQVAVVSDSNATSPNRATAVAVGKTVTTKGSVAVAAIGGLGHDDELHEEAEAASHSRHHHTTTPTTTPQAVAAESKSLFPWRWLVSTADSSSATSAAPPSSSSSSSSAEGGQDPH